MSFNLEIGLILLEELTLIALPAVAALLFAMQRGVRSPTLLVGVALAASGAVAMLAFWAFYTDPTLGKAFAFLAVFASLVAIFLLWREGIDRERVRALLPPLVLWVLASVFVLYLGFLHGTTHEVLEVARNRFTGELPTDNAIPRYFADWFYVHGHHGTPPPFAGWLSSDRPPLQIGYTLALRPFGWDGRSLHYEVLGVAIQQLWVPAAWALLSEARLGRTLRGLAIVAAMISDVAIVHGFFVWPKLIAAAFLLVAVAMAISPEWRCWSRDPRVGGLFAALVVLALLSHGSSIFLAIPLVVFAALRAIPDRRWLVAALGVLVVLYAPWSAYQKWGDPPGNRLIKYQLAGSPGLDGRGSLQTIVDSYREEGLGGDLADKWRNVKTMFDTERIQDAAPIQELPAVVKSDLDAGDPGEALEAIRVVRFYGLVPFLGLLLLGLPAMLIRAVADRDARSGPEWGFVKLLGGLTLAGCLVWALLMFGNEAAEAVIHQGALAIPLLAVFVCVAAAYAGSRRFATGLVAVNSLFVLFLLGPYVHQPPGTSYSVVAAILAALGLAGFCRLALRSPWDDAEERQYTLAP